MTGQHQPGRAASESRRNKQRLASELGISVTELTRLHQRLGAAGTSLQGFSAKERTEKAAARLRLTPPELKDLRRAVSGAGLPVDERMASIIRTVLDKSADPTVASPNGAQRPKPPQLKKSKSKKGDRPIFLTKWGQAVHLFYDCVNIRGFRELQEPDPDIYRVHANDPSCRGRKVCGTCTRHSHADGAKVKEALRRFHGLPFSEAKWRDESWHRVHPKEPPFIVGGSGR